MSQSLDLADPVLTIISIITDNFSQLPVTVATGFTRGGYAVPWPDIIPVEGPVDASGNFYPRKGRTDLEQAEGQAEVVIYEVSDAGDEEKTVDQKFGDVRTRVTIDIYHAESKARLHSLWLEIKRCLYKSKNNPGGNYSFLVRGQKTDMSNRQAGFWRYVQEVELVKVSDYFGHA
jgi:hypothetical protein